MREGRNTNSVGSSAWWAVPAILWMGIFLVAPLVLIVVVSFMTRGPHGGVVAQWTLQNFVRAMDPLYLKIYGASFRFAGLTALACLVLGYPTAYVMATVPKWARQLMLVGIMLPFLTNFVIRAFGIKILLARNGPVNGLLLSLGVIDGPLVLSDGSLAIWFGMVTNYLPFMVLPLFIELEKFDFRLIEAARDLGATGLQATGRILLPLTLKPMLAGLSLVFIPAFGEFLIPDFLGGARQMLLGNLLTEQFLRARDWPFGCVLSLVMFAIVFSMYGLRWRFSGSVRAGRSPKINEDSI